MSINDDRDRPTGAVFGASRPTDTIVPIPSNKPCANMPTLSVAKHNIFLSAKTAVVRVFGDKPILGTAALLESVKRSLNLLQLVAGDVADHCLELKMVTYFDLIDETSLRSLTRQCRRQQLASCCPDTSSPSTASIPEPASPADTPMVCAKRPRSANVQVPELAADPPHDPQANLDDFLEGIDFDLDFFIG